MKQICFVIQICVVGAKVNWVNEDDDDKSALHQSILGVCAIS